MGVLGTRVGERGLVCAQTPRVSSGLAASLQGQRNLGWGRWLVQDSKGQDSCSCTGQFSS